MVRVGLTSASSARLPFGCREGGAEGSRSEKDTDATRADVRDTHGSDGDGGDACEGEEGLELHDVSVGGVGEESESDATISDVEQRAQLSGRVHSARTYKTRLVYFRAVAGQDEVCKRADGGACCRESCLL